MKKVASVVYYIGLASAVICAVLMAVAFRDHGNGLMYYLLLVIPFAFVCAGLISAVFSLWYLIVFVENAVLIFYVINTSPKDFLPFLILIVVYNILGLLFGLSGKYMKNH